jgi:microcystin-dependent protein
MDEAFLGEIRAVAFDYAPDGWLPCDGRLLPIAQYNALYALLGTNFGGDARSTFGLPDLRGSVPIGMGKGTYLGASTYNMGNKGGVEQVSLTPAQTPLAPHIHPTTVTDPVYTASLRDAAYGAAVTDPTFTANVSGTVTPKAKTGGGPLTNSPAGAVSAPSGNTNIYSATPNANMAPADVALSVTLNKTSPGSVAISKTSAGSVTISKTTGGTVTVGSNPFNTPQYHENRMPYQTINYIICCSGIFPPRPY